MKKTLNILFVILLLSTSMLFAVDKVKVEVAVSDRAENACKGPGGSATEDLYDFQFEYPVGVGGGEAGVECDGNYIYTTKWNGSEFYRYELDGTYLESFTVAGASNVRDLAYDGQYFYGGAASTALFEMDFTPGAEVLISTITAPVAVRAIAYDPVNDGFWANNWSDQITLFDRSGATLDSFACGAVNSFYGFAWEDVLPGGPYLWGAAQSGTGNDLVKMDIANGGTQLEVYDVANSGISYAAGEICGGLYITDEIVAGKWTIGGIVQNVSIWGLELADSAPLDAPGAPTGVTVVPDAGGALEATIDWTCPDVQVNGDPLTELTEMNVYRDDVLVYTDSSPTIGGPGSYTDVVPSSAIYAYKVVGVNSAGEGLPVIISTWVGEDVPNVVEDLVLTNVNNEGYLTWTNPTTGLNGGAFNEMILGYHITRSDGTEFEETGLLTEWTDTNIPSPDYYSYDVQAYNSVGDGGVATSNTEWIGDAFSGIVILDLDPTSTGSTLQTSIENFYAGSVVLTSDINAYPLTSDVDAVFVLLGIYSSNYTLTEAEAGPLTTYLDGGGNVYMEGGDTWYYDTATSLHPYFNINPVADGSADLSNIDGMDFLTGMSWSYSGENNWIDQLAPVAPAVTVFNNPTAGYDCGIAYDSGTYKTVGTSFEITGLGGTNTLDDAVEGIGNFLGIFGPMPDPGWIEGTVTLDGGTGNVEDVEVSAGGVTVNPAADGTYSIELDPGTYDVTAMLDGYEDAMIGDVVVEEGIATTGQDLTLIYIQATFYPPVNLAVDDNNLFTWEAPGTPSGFFEGFEGTFPPDGWLKLNPDGGTGWEPLEVGTTPLPGWTGGEATAPPEGGNWQAYATWTTGGAVSNDQWLITPQITVQDGDMLDFWMALYYDSYADYVEVLISTTDQNDVNAFDTVVDQIEFPLGSSTDWTQYTYNLTDFVAAGTPVYIAFREMVADNLAEGSAISIDNILVGTPASFNGVATNLQTSNITRELSYTHVPNTHVVATRDLESYDVYLDGALLGNTTDLFWQFTDLVEGQEYEAGVVAVYTDGVSDMATILFNATSDANNNTIGISTALTGNYPNPFNPVTNIAYSIQEAGNVTLEVYNLRGQLVKTLVNNVQEAGEHVQSWNGTDDSGKAVSSGVYFYKMKSGNYTATKKMILMK